MTKTPQWLFDAAIEYDETGYRHAPYDDDRAFPNIAARHMLKDPVRKLAGELVWAVQHAGLSSPAYWKIREIARELKKELEG